MTWKTLEQTDMNNRTIIRTATRILAGRNIVTRGSRRFLITSTLIAAMLLIGFLLLAGRNAPSAPIGTQPVSPAATTSSPAAPADAVPDAPAGTPSPEAGHALAMLEQLTVADPIQTPYDRNAFGQRWADIDHDGCDQRNNRLSEVLVDVTFKPGTRDCVVLTGTLHDKYTGTTINFVRGQNTSAAIQIDHVVPLAWAWRNGAADWPAQRREQFANDSLNLEPVDGPANQSKSDRGPALWMPPNTGYHCDYDIRFVAVLHAYELAVPADDAAALRTTLTACSTAGRS